MTAWVFSNSNQNRKEVGQFVSIVFVHLLNGIYLNILNNVFTSLRSSATFICKIMTSIFILKKRFSIKDNSCKKNAVYVRHFADITPWIMKYKMIVCVSLLVFAHLNEKSLLVRTVLPFFEKRTISELWTFCSFSLWSRVAIVFLLNYDAMPVCSRMLLLCISLMFSPNIWFIRCLPSRILLYQHFPPIPIAKPYGVAI